jgi:NTP pyrophosphatase (non-canonical NTP hydrolase)
MTANEYQALAGRTLLNAPDFKINDKEIMLVWNALGLAGEAGEAADLVKKGVFHQQGIDYEKLLKELGDVLWYVAAISSTLGVSLEEIMLLNIKKLDARFPEGYSPDRTTVREGDAA